MEALPQFPKDYFNKFPETPVAIKPFNPQSLRMAEDCIKKLKSLLKGFRVKIICRGSTVFQIAGKGDVEIGVYPKEKDWAAVLGVLKDHYGKVGNLEENYARFNDQVNGFEVEVIMLKGQEAKLDLKLTEHLLSHPDLLREYERLKRKYAYSKREYQKQKDRFFRKVARSIPNQNRFG